MAWDLKKMVLALGLLVLAAPAWAAADLPAAASAALRDPALFPPALMEQPSCPSLRDLCPAQPWGPTEPSAKQANPPFLDSLVTREQMEGIYLDAHEQAKAVLTRMLINLATRLLD